MVRMAIVSLVALFSVSAIANGQTSTQAQPNQQKGERGQAIKLDGEWTVQYMEIDGKAVENKSVANVTIKNNVVTCRHDGKEKTYRLEFGPHHMVRCTEQVDGKTTSDPGDKRDSSGKGYHSHHGIYIASQEFFCLSMNKGMDRRSFTSDSTERPQPGKQNPQPGNAQPAQGFGADQTPYACSFVLILRRSGTTK
jgi:hypothetical protein